MIRRGANMQSKLKNPLALLAFALTLAFASPAAAGIIVVVGMPAPTDSSHRTKPGANLPSGDRSTTATTSPCPSDALPDKSDKSACAQKIDPVTGLPADWKCVPIGGGRLYCEAPSGSGGSAGAGGEGAWDGEGQDWVDLEDESFDEASEELQVMGCEGGASAGGLFGMLLAAAAALALRRSRGRA